MKIRQFQDSDAEKVSDLIKETLISISSKDYSSDTIKALILDTKPSELVEKAKYGYYYVMEEQSHIIGIGGFDDTHVHNVYVQRDHIGKGVGKQIMDRIINKAKEEGIFSLKCASLLSSEQFYLKLGFKRLREETCDFYHTKLTYILMEKIL